MSLLFITFQIANLLSVLKTCDLAFFKDKMRLTSYCSLFSFTVINAIYLFTFYEMLLVNN